MTWQEMSKIWRERIPKPYHRRLADWDRHPNKAGAHLDEAMRVGNNAIRCAKVSILAGVAYFVWDLVEWVLR
jgi:hypothetical protein